LSSSSAIEDLGSEKAGRAGEVEIDCPTQLAILYSFDDTLIVSEQVGKKAQQEQA